MASKPERDGPVDDLTRMSVAFGHVAVIMMICKARALSWLTKPLADIGRMALTNYVLQTIICTTLFAGFGFGLFGQLARHRLHYIVLGIWLFEWIASVLWLRWFRFGPLEWVWRWLSYRQRPAIRIPDPFRLSALSCQLSAPTPQPVTEAARNPGCAPKRLRREA